MTAHCSSEPGAIEIWYHQLPLWCGIPMLSTWVSVNQVYLPEPKRLHVLAEGAQIWM
jgi:hypothetical protein